MNLKLSKDTLSLVSDKTKFYAQPAAVLNLISELTESVSGFMNPKQKARFYANAIIALNDKTVQSFPPLTVIGILIESATYDLSLSKSLQECYIIPYNNALQFIVGYKGWIKMFNRSGNVGTIGNDVVYSGDHFESKMVNGVETISHDRKAKNTGVLLASDNVTHSWVTIITKDGFLYSSFLTKAQILQRMDVAGKKENKGAYAFYEPMFIKGCFKVMAKIFPLADEDKGIRDECTFIPTINGNEISFDAAYDELPQASAKALPTADEDKIAQILVKIDNCTDSVQLLVFGKSLNLTEEQKNISDNLNQKYKQLIKEERAKFSVQLSEIVVCDKIEDIKILTKNFVEQGSMVKGSVVNNAIAQKFKMLANDLVEGFFVDGVSLAELENVPQIFNDTVGKPLTDDRFKDLNTKYTNFVAQFKQQQNA